VIEAGGADELFDGFDGCFSHGLWGKVGGEELGRDHVDAGVSALRGENGGDEQLPRGGVNEGALDVGVGFVEDLEDGLDALGFDFEFGYAVAGGWGWQRLGVGGAVGWERLCGGFLLGGLFRCSLFRGGFFGGSFCGLRRHVVIVPRWQADMDAFVMIGRGSGPSRPLVGQMIGRWRWQG